MPDGVWYLLCSKENTSAQHGQWRAKGETCEIFSNSYIIGWRTTLEFFEGQVPNERKTDWVMQEFRITQKRLYGDKKEEVFCLPCTYALLCLFRCYSQSRLPVNYAFVWTMCRIPAHYAESFWVVNKVLTMKCSRNCLAPILTMKLIVIQRN